jgi:hypothetical protein
MRVLLRLTSWRGFRVRVVAVLLCSILLVQVAYGQERLRSGEGEAVFAGERSVIVLSRGQILFNVDGPPGVYEADGPVEVLIGGDPGNWVLSCQAEPLIGERGEIPPDRLFVNYVNADPRVDNGAGGGFYGLGEPIVLAEGPSLGPVPMGVNTLRVRLLTSCYDTPGVYVGAVILTYLHRP